MTISPNQLLKKSFLLFLFPFLLFNIVVPSSWAFRRMRTDLQVPLFWSKIPIFYAIGKRGCKDIKDGSDKEAIHRAFRTWSALDCTRLKFKYEGLIEHPEIAYQEGQTNHNVIFWINDEDKWLYPTDVLAFTRLEYNRKTGEIYDADLAMNGAYFKWSTQHPVPTGYNSVLNTITHEIGHFLGLDHSEVPSATMYPNAKTGETQKEDLDPDDRLGICTIYPLNPQWQFSFLVIGSESGLAPCAPSSTETPSSPPPSSSGCTCQLQTHSHNWDLSWLFLLLLFILWKLSLRNPFPD